MHAVNDVRALPKAALYDELESSLRALLAGEPHFIACAANMSSLLYWSLPDLNWVGFYLLDETSGDFWHFMVPENFEQHTAGKEAMGDSAMWLKDGTMCTVMLWNGVPLSVNAPAHVELKIVETDPGVRGDTATGGQKPAKLETGAVVRVPLFLNEGEVIRVDTRTSEYLSRAKS